MYKKDKQILAMSWSLVRLGSKNMGVYVTVLSDIVFVSDFT